MAAGRSTRREGQWRAAAGFPSLAYDGGMNTLGLLTNITEVDGTTDDYGYDALSRLTSETRSDPNGNPEDGHAYGYDLAGNRTTEDGGAFVTPDATNCPTAIVAQGVTLARDADGNITGSLPSAPGLFAWDDRNKLVTLNVGNGAYVLQYGYDALGHCVFESPAGYGVDVFHIFDGYLLLGDVYAFPQQSGSAEPVG